MIPNQSYDQPFNTILNNYLNYVNTNNRILSNTIDVIHAQNIIYNSIIHYYISGQNPRPPNPGPPNPGPSNPGPPNPGPPNSGPPNSGPIPSMREPTPVSTNVDSFLSHIFLNILNSNYDVVNSPTNLVVTSVNRRRENTPVPTINDLLQATTYCIYSEIENPINEACPISQKDFSNNDIVLVINTCKHIFEPTSIMKWFTRRGECPLCRRTIIHRRETRENENENENENADTDTETENETIENEITENGENETTENNNSSFMSQHLAYIITNDLESYFDFSNNLL